MPARHPAPGRCGGGALSRRHRVGRDGNQASAFGPASVVWPRSDVTAWTISAKGAAGAVPRGTDGLPGAGAPLQGFYVGLHIRTPEEAERVYQGLAENATIQAAPPKDVLVHALRLARGSVRGRDLLQVERRDGSRVLSSDRAGRDTAGSEALVARLRESTAGTPWLHLPNTHLSPAHGAGALMPGFRGQCRPRLHPEH